MRLKLYTARTRGVLAPNPHGTGINAITVTTAANCRSEDASMEILYTRVDDYLLPNLKLSDVPDAPPLGRWQMHKAYLREHSPIRYNQLLMPE